MTVFCFRRSKGQKKVGSIDNMRAAVDTAVTSLEQVVPSFTSCAVPCICNSLRLYAMCESPPLEYRWNLESVKPYSGPPASP
eukprot:7378332-Prymnesium_polylepis.1